MGVHESNGVRRTNLRRVVEELGGHSAVAKRLKLSGSSWVSQLIQGIRPFTEKTARKFEKQLGLKPGYLDQAVDGSASQSQPVIVNRDIPLVKDVSDIVNSSLTARKQTLSNAKFGAVVDAVFSQALKTGKVDLELVEKILDILG